uniref:Uncharacterized protein n=1 Tax=Globodera rostochiensis TaxID=31243 RepID=A0A914IEZ9_GLORO
MKNIMIYLMNCGRKEENVEKRVKSEFIEFDRISDKEEFDNEKDGEEQSTDSYSLFDNSNLKESFSKSQKGVKKKYLEIEKQEIIAEWKNQLGVSKNQKKHTDAEREFLVQHCIIGKTKMEFQKNKTDTLTLIM